MTKQTVDTDKFELLAKQSKQAKKKKSIWMMIIAIISSVFVVFLLLFGVFLLNDRHYFRNSQYVEAKVNFMMPNLMTKFNVVGHIGLYSGKSVTSVEKNVAGYRVDWGSITGNFNALNTAGDISELNIGGSSYPEGREMSLFNPNIRYTAITQEARDKALATGDYRKKSGKNGSSSTIFPERLFEEVSYPNDLDSVANTPNRVVEVGISFDKPYTYAEIKHMLPNTLNKAWYWLSEGNKKTKTTEHIFLNEADDRVNPSTVTFGYSNAENLMFDEPRIRDYAKEKNGLSQLFNTLQDKYAGKMTEVERDTLDRILKQNNLANKDNTLLNGIVLTGKSEDFKQLAGKSWIRAASAGASAQTVPYISPTE